MKLAINVLSLQGGHSQRGIGYYTRYLLEQLKLDPRVEICEFERISQVQQADVIHYPYFDLYYPTLPLIKRYPTVVTIHDVTPLVFPDKYPPGIKGKVSNYYQKLALKNVRAVVTDSNASKLDLVKLLNLSSDKIYPVHLAPPPEYKIITSCNELARVRKKYNLPEKFGLYVGGINWNKNILNLTEGCIKIGLELCLVGGDFLTKNNLNHPELKSFFQFIQKYGHNPSIHILGFVPTEDLVVITNLAKIGLLPSFYEGFGLSILQYQKCKVPVITSNLSSMSEVAGAGAVLVDPGQPEQISRAIVRILTDADLHSKLIKAGLANAELFNWRKVADETIKVYQRAITR